MTRSAWVTVRLPGARTAPATSTRIWFQTGAVKHGRKAASQDIRIAGTAGWAAADSMRLGLIESVESSRPHCARVPVRASPRDARHQIVASPTIRRSRRPNLYRTQPGALLARLRPTGSDDSKYSIGRSGRTDRLLQDPSAAPSGRFTRPRAASR